MRELGDTDREEDGGDGLTEIQQARSLASSPAKSIRSNRASGAAMSSSPLKKQASPEKQTRSRAWDSLWSLDLNLESGKGKGK